jgi:nucleobase:cation symporter-1, NCS1 family
MDIQPIAIDKRTLSGQDYFLLWAGVAISLAEIWAGGFLAPLGLWMGFWVIILGHIIGNTFMALGGVIGSEHGIMAMVSVRPSFGIKGSSIAAIFNIIQLIGWASIMLIIAGRAGAMLGQSAGGVMAAHQFWIVLIGLGTLLWALYTGRSIWKIMQTIAVIGLLLVAALMTWVSFGDLGQEVQKTEAAAIPFMTGLDLVIAMPISWMPLVADYSRFSKNTSSAFWNTWWGYFIVSSWMYVIGLVATLATGGTDPATLVLGTMGKLGLAVPALIMVVFSTITSDFPDIYSATCSILNISQKIKATTLMWAVGILSILVALVFPMEQYENFLLLIGAMFIPLFGVVLTDYFIVRKRKLSVEEIYRNGGAYWYFKGFNPKALGAWAVGFIVFELIAIKGIPVGGSLPSFFTAALCYYFLSDKLQRS